MNMCQGEKVPKSMGLIGSSSNWINGHSTPRLLWGCSVGSGKGQEYKRWSLEAGGGSKKILEVNRLRES